jgi:hypothetical protein
MKQVRQGGDLQINQDMSFQRRSWQVQRVGWWVMLLFIMLGLLGLLGSGPLSHTTLSTSDRSLQLEYDRFIRLHAPNRLRIQAAPREDSKQQTVRVQISDDYLERFQILQISPQPEQTTIQSNAHFYSFSVTSSTQPISIIIDLEADQMGQTDGTIALDSETMLQFWQWVYP